MTIMQLSILKQDGSETTLSFSDNGVLKNRHLIDEAKNRNIETIYLHRDPGRYVNLISDVLQRENINDAVAISGIFKDDDGTIFEQEGLLGSMFYTNIISKPEESQGE